MGRKSNLEKIYRVECENGYYLFKLNSLLEKRHRTKNSVLVEKNIDFNTIQRIVIGNLSRVDLTTIAKLCNELNCKFEDIIEYVNYDKKK